MLVEEGGLASKKVVACTEMVEITKEVAELEAMKDSKVATRAAPGVYKVGTKERVVVEVCHCLV